MNGKAHKPFWPLAPAMVKYATDYVKALDKHYRRTKDTRLSYSLSLTILYFNLHKALLIKIDSFQLSIFTQFVL